MKRQSVKALISSSSGLTSANVIYILMLVQSRIPTFLKGFPGNKNWNLTLDPSVEWHDVISAPIEGFSYVAMQLRPNDAHTALLDLNSYKQL